MRLAILVAAGELAVWAALGRALVERREPPRNALLLAVAAGAVLHALGPLWAWLGARVSRPLVAGLLLLAALAVDGAWLGLPERISGIPLWAVLLALSLPALGDLASSAAADAVTVERRPAAHSVLEMGRGFGVALGLAAGASSPRALFHLLPLLALILGAAMLTDLRDRGTPRSTWPLPVRTAAAKSVGTALVLALVTGLFSAAALALSSGVTLAGKALPPWGATIWLLAPLAGMAIFAQIDSRLPDGAVSLRLAAALSVAAFICAPEGPEGLGGTVALVALGGAAAALPATIIRETGEMQRAPASSAAWTALTVGAGLGALLGIAAA